MKLPLCALLCLGIAASCAGDPDLDDEQTQEAQGQRGRRPRLGIDTDTPVDASCTTPPSASDAGTIDAGTPNAQVGTNCDVVLRVTTASGDDEAVITPASGEQLVTLWAENVSARVQTFRYSRPCAGPALVGLGAYDARRACMAGRCESPRPPVEVVLAPGARTQLGLGYVSATPDSCNRQGLAAGTYDVGYALVGLTGVAVCEEPLRLSVR